MKFKSSSLDRLSKGHTKLLVFDCEFWHVYGSEGYIPMQNSSDQFFMPREIGGFFLQRSKDGQWIYRNHFFVTLFPPKGEDVSFVSSMYAGVTRQTDDLLNKYQSLLERAWDKSFLHTLPEKLHPVLVDGINVYLEDENIKRAHKPASWYRSFLEEFSTSYVIVKGPSDIEALKNACKFHNIAYSPPKGIFDIAVWNPQSRKRCGSAKLEQTFKCIYKKLNEEDAKLLDILPLGEAHDPSSDAAMTLVIALYIQSKK